MGIRRWLGSTNRLLGITSNDRTHRLLRSSQRGGSSKRTCNVESLENRSMLAAGALDTTLDGNGKKLVGFSSDDRAEAVAVAGDGKIVMVGYTKVGNYNKFAISRQNANGTLDTTFSGDGKMTISFGSTRNDRAFAVKIISGNKIVVAGESVDSSGSGDFALARINANGTLDSSFSGDGGVRVGWGGDERAYGLELGETDGYLMAGYAKGSKDRDFAVARINNAGNLDPSFSSDGKHLYNFTGRVDKATNIVRDGSGGYIVGGTSNDSSGSGDFGLVRIFDHGLPNTAFSSDGFQRVGFNSNDVLTGLRIDTATNRVVASGTTSPSSGLAFAVSRLTLGGVFDASFSGDGKYAGKPASGTFTANDLLVDSSGRIYVGGTYLKSGNYDFAMFRLTSSGSPDTSFSGDSRANFGMDSDSYDVGVGMSFDNQGRILIAGRAKLTPTATTFDFGLMRILIS